MKRWVADALTELAAGYLAAVILFLVLAAYGAASQP